MPDVLKISHGWGFFSCCSVRLWDIMEYVKRNNALPDVINDEGLFSRYKMFPHSVVELFFSQSQIELNAADTFNFFVVKDGSDLRQDVQFSKYSALDFPKATKWITRYFEPSNAVRLTIDRMRARYPQFQSGKVCSVFYRGNDKCTESKVAPHALFIDKAAEILAQKPDTVFHVQTDELDFAEAFFQRFSGRSFCCHETPMIRKTMSTVTDMLPPMGRIEFAINFLAVVYILAQSRTVITHSGNCGLWAALFRGHANNLHQCLDNTWL